MTTLNDYFDGIYCINLDRRKDRWQECEKLFEKHNLKVERVSAIDWKDINWIDPKLGEKYKANVANLMSVIRMIRLAGSKQNKKILLLEDDVDFIDNINEKFADQIQYVPINWGFMYLGGNHEGGHIDVMFDTGELSPIIKCIRTYALHAFAFTDRTAPLLWRELSRVLFHIRNNPNEKYRDVVCADYWIGEMQSNTPTYSFRQPMAWQRNDYSDIEQQNSNYEWLKHEIK